MATSTGTAQPFERCTAKASGTSEDSGRMVEAAKLQPNSTRRSSTRQRIATPRRGPSSEPRSRKPPVPPNPRTANREPRIRIHSTHETAPVPLAVRPAVRHWPGDPVGMRAQSAAPAAQAAPTAPALTEKHAVRCGGHDRHAAERAEVLHPAQHAAGEARQPCSWRSRRARWTRRTISRGWRTSSSTWPSTAPSASSPAS